MASYIARRLLLMIPTLLGITFLVFMLVALSPGGIGAALKVSTGQMEATSRALQEAYLDDRYGLDDSPVIQYVRWLERISPVKFGVRDQVAPSGERIQPPKEVKVPPMHEWFVDELPVVQIPEKHVWPDGSTEATRAREYRRSANVYANSRAAYVGMTAVFQQQLANYAKSKGLRRAVTKDDKIRPAVLRRSNLTRSGPEWELIEADAANMINAYEIALRDQRSLRAVFNAQPFPNAGFAVIPGAVSVASPDFGVSFSRSRPVAALLREALPVTLLLNLIAFPIIYMIAIPGGMLAATHRGGIFDTLSGAAFVALWSIPTVWAGVLAIGFLANNQYLGWFPVSGLHSVQSETYTFLPMKLPDGTWERGYILDTLWHLCLPVTCLVYTGFAVLSKQTRAAMLDNFNADYVRTAKAKGVTSRDIVYKHVFRNSLLPLITMFVSIFPATLAGSVVIERIFTIPGMGNLIIESINLRDREVILANTLMIGAVNLLALLLADIMYALADPRVSFD